MEQSGADLEAAYQLVAVLEATDGVRMASVYGRDKVELNARRIVVKIEAPADDPKGRTIIQVTANWSAEVDSWLACAQVATKKVAAITGEAAIAAARQKLELRSSTLSFAPAQQPPSAEELEWLAHWCDSQPCPDEVSTEQAAAALAQHQAAGSSSSNSTVFAVLHEAQLIRAKHRAAELRHSKAAADMAKYAEQIAELQPEKRQRTEEAPSPSQYWDGWSHKEFKRQEAMIAARRDVELKKDAPARLPLEMPRGERDGPLDHERLGLVGSLQYWAEGSHTDAAKLVGVLATSESVCQP